PPSSRRSGDPGGTAARRRGRARGGRGGTSSAASRLATFIEDQPDGTREPRPAVLFDGQLPPACARERVDLGVAPGLRRLPFGPQPAFLLEAVQGWIERALVDLDHGARDLLEPLR